tara:strand:- start:346 stop:498 length:153 start_codon:yes stop_codon:yes gene_type:complete
VKDADAGIAQYKQTDPQEDKETVSSSSSKQSQDLFSESNQEKLEEVEQKL